MIKTNDFDFMQSLHLTKTRRDTQTKLHNSLIRAGYTFDENDLTYTYTSDSQNDMPYSETISFTHFAMMVDDMYEHEMTPEPIISYNISKINDICNKINITYEGSETGIVTPDDFADTYAILDCDGWREHKFNTVCSYYPIDGLTEHSQTIINYILTDISTGLALVDLRRQNVIRLLKYLSPVVQADLLKIAKDARDKQYEEPTQELFDEEDSL